MSMTRMVPVSTRSRRAGAISPLNWFPGNLTTSNSIGPYDIVGLLLEMRYEIPSPLDRGRGGGCGCGHAWDLRAIHIGIAVRAQVNQQAEEDAEPAPEVGRAQRSHHQYPHESGERQEYHSQQRPDPGIECCIDHWREDPQHENGYTWCECAQQGKETWH